MEREVITIDAQDRRLGNLATDIAYYLEGKNTPAFEYHKDNGARVIVYNIDTMSVHPRKVRQRAYYRHSGYRKGLQKSAWEDLMQEDPRHLLHSAVERMLPKNKLQNERMKHLEMYRGAYTEDDN